MSFHQKSNFGRDKVWELKICKRYENLCHDKISCCCVVMHGKIPSFSKFFDTYFLKVSFIVWCLCGAYQSAWIKTCSFVEMYLSSLQRNKLFLDSKKHYLVRERALSRLLMITVANMLRTRTQSASYTSPTLGPVLKL